jgi:pimeloyl-ACP methyl ester carboxylesterase
VAHYQDQYTCYVLTLAGFAGVPPITSPLLSTVRDDLAVYIRQNHLEKPVIVGHSLGGTLALELAARSPELIGPLVIVDSLPFMAGPTFRVKNLDDAKPGIAAMHAYLSALTPEQRAENVRSAASFKYMVTNPSDLELLKQWGLATDPKTATEAMCELFSTDLRPDLSRISSPTLILGTWIGLQGQIKQYSQNVRREDFVDTFQQQYANLPHLHFVMSDKARHFIMFDDPRWFFQQLDAFLANPMAAAADRGFSSK